MAKTQAKPKRGPKTRTALSDKQIIAAREESPRFYSDERLEWTKPAKVVARKAGVAARSLQNWRDREKTPLYWAEVLRLLWEKAEGQIIEPAATVVPPPLTEREVQVLFEMSELPVVLGGLPYYDWKPYWDQMQALGLILPRKNLSK